MRDFDRLEENMKIFIQRMQEKYQEDKYAGHNKTKQYVGTDTSDESSLQDEEDEKDRLRRSVSQSSSSHDLKRKTEPQTPSKSHLM